jgi:hypothetical protein
MLGEEEPEMSDGEEMEWKYKIYEEDERATKGVNQEAEIEEWDKGIEKQLTVDEESKKDEKESTTTKGKSKGGTTKKRGRPSKNRQEREDSSDLSDEGGREEAEAEDQDGEQEAEEETTKGRSKRANAGKRKRDSAAKEESEDEKEVKETVSVPSGFRETQTDNV